MLTPRCLPGSWPMPRIAAAADYLNTPKSAPAYTRFESSMLVAFDGMKRLAVPAAVVEKKPWIYELRIYESHSEQERQQGEDVQQRRDSADAGEVGLTPVFFGQTLVGTQMPNLIYMVSGENQDEHKKHWKDFFDAPVWKTLIGDPQYKDNVSKVISIFLKRTSASQI